MSVNDINQNTSDLVNSKGANSIKSDIFHAVYIPGENELSEDSLHVYSDKLKALKVIKSNKLARLKSFTSRIEADEFAKCGSKETNFSQNNTDHLPLMPDIDDKFPEFKPIPASSPCKAPTPQELVRFRKIIERGDLDLVRETVYGNPRYLIGVGFTPALLQEGCRYNALHIAASKSTKPAEMCKLILEIVSDEDFIEELEGMESSKLGIDRAQIFLDLFLNTPDKGLNETPLHFAAKYGLKAVVQLLVSYPECIKIYKNKYDQTPVDVICTRKCQEDEALKREIRMLIEDQYFVPVLRSEDNSLPPVIGEPFSPASPPKMKTDILSPVIQVKAFAGPMSKSQAIEFRKKWKTPPRNLFKTPTKNCDNKFDESFSLLNSSSSKDSLKRLQDFEKGVELVGRDLAEECHVSWKEYWPFLRGFADLRSGNGLELLENYLKDNFCRKLTSKKDARKTFNFYEEDCDEAFYTPPESPVPLFTKNEEDSEDEIFHDVQDDMFRFINGSKPSKIDWDVFNAVPEQIDRDNFPFVYLWRHEMIINKQIDDCCSLLRMKLVLSSPK